MSIHDTPEFPDTDLMTRVIARCSRVDVILAVCAGVLAVAAGALAAPL